MYSKTELSSTKHDFWIAFGKYMAPIASSEGLKANWVNYKTGFKSLSFKMEVDTRKAYIGIEITHSDVELQEMFWHYFLELKNWMHQSFGEEWHWRFAEPDKFGKPISSIYTEKSPVNVMKQEDWPKIISFFKPRIIALDEFWNDVKDRFEELR